MQILPQLNLSNHPSGFNPFLLVRLSYFSLVCIAFCLASCASTKTNEYGPCATQLKSGNKVLIPWLPRGSHEFDLHQVTRLLAEVNVKVGFVPSEEWALSAAGVTLPIDSTKFKLLSAIVYTHLLLIKETDNKTADLVRYYTNYELELQRSTYAYKPLTTSHDNRSEVMMQLISLADPSAIYKIVTTTSIGGIGIQHRDKSVTNVNASSTRMARSKAIKKGLKVMKRSCEER